MNDARLSPSTRKLLEKAKTDVPSAGTRARIWDGVSGAAAGTIGASSTTASVIQSGSSGTKLLSIGSLFGGTLTVGVAALLLTLSPALHDPQPKASALRATGQATLVSAIQPAMRVSAAGVGDAKPAHTATSIAKPPSAPARANKKTFSEDSLAHEAWLVSEARNALGHGNPELALRSIRAARALRSHQLVPEELAVEEQALRAIGRSDEANGIDVQLRLQYPDSALAR